MGEKNICETNKECMGMKLVEVDQRYRVTIPKEIRKTFKIAKGQKFYLVPYGDDLLIKQIPMDAAQKLDEIVGDFKFSRKTRRKAEKWLLDL